MSRTWGNFLQNNRLQNQIRRAIATGDLYVAADQVTRNRIDQTSVGKQLVTDLTGALVGRSRDSSVRGNLSAAWKDLTIASTVAFRQDLDWLSNEKSQLVELTVESAESLLTYGKLSSTLKLVNELRSRQILDWRADRIESIARLLKSSEALLAQGELGKATDCLLEARNLRPDLTFVESKLAGIQTRAPQFRALKTALKYGLLQNNWKEVERTCGEILAIAPNYQVALDARRRFHFEKQKRPAATSTEDKRSYFKIDNKLTWVADPVAGKKETGKTVVAKSNSPEEHAGASQSKPFMLWIDGVGGYRVCPNEGNFIGQAVADANIEIPMRGDLLRRHARIETVGRTLMIHPMGSIKIDDSEIDTPTVLRDGQQLALGPIKMSFRQAHPLSGSASLNFLSRHRTQPWSDGVLFANGPIVLGRNARNHVICRGWTHELLLFERNGKWFVRTDGKIDVDGNIFDKEAEVKLDSRVSGEGFSLSLEAL